jgi:hypothetical protein
MSVKRLWRRMRGRNWERTWRDDIGPQIAGLVTSGQAAAANASSNYIADVLDEFGMQVDAPTDFLPDGFAGVTGGGVAVEDAAYQAVIKAAQAQYRTDVDSGDLLTTERAVQAGENFLAELTASMMADAMRAAEEVAMAQRPWVDGYVRIVEPGACSRCIILAGKFFLFNDGFLRHPRCRCNHAPAPSDPNRLRDLIAAESPERLFESLSEAEQDRIFTRAGAEAIREGADMGRVVNARKGMRRAQVYGKDVLITSAGIAESRRDRKRRPVRLMPEAIFQIAGGDRDEVLRLLRVHGYIT